MASVLHGLRLRQARERRDAKLTYRELADLTGLSRSAINEYFTGKVLPPTDRFDVLLDAFGVEEDERRALATARDRVEEHLHAERSGGAPRRRVPRELPPPVSSFTGRSSELAALDHLARTAADPTGSAIAAVCGTAGVGKTALVAHWAHRNRHRFPDGDLYVDLQGYHPDGPVHPAEALARMMRGLGVDDALVPEGLQERAAQYRTLLADRAVLVVLDNASSVDQVRDLLPGGRAFALITSRDSLAGLAVRNGVRRVPLDLLPHDDAVELLRAVLGAERVDAESEAAAALIEHCAHLPLALRIAAEHAASRPGAELAGLAQEVAEEPLALFDEVGDDRTAPRTVFSWSYRHLPEHAATAFRRLGLHPGHDIDVGAVAALCDVDASTARRTLRALSNVSMVTETDRGRFSPHDLLRCYATELVARDDPATTHAALERLISHYCRVVAAAVDLAFPSTRRTPSAVEPADTTVRFESGREAVEWLNHERAALVALTRYAADHGLPEFADALSASLWYYLNSRRHFTDARVVHTCAIRAAQAHRDRIAEARALNHLANVEWMLGRFPAAAEQLRRALELSRDLDSDVTAQTLNGLAVACWMSGQFTEAIPYYRQAVPWAAGSTTSAGSCSARSAPSTSAMAAPPRCSPTWNRRSP
ncbi:transcriptional regulator with XRE-family HTH domain [Saccharothrix tamanrassetensis]|uniref:Transcriptional regulator with XRE-family HTH domain n=1 Tax=Saccharothrix tamanrassetensis TaxID=1051531 RepID=A0A841CTU8_9PSEU|nr:tetratricopeptide repeat protein [Saccharothrix tamanrassetensis]MBB5960740.1 transcriptional regulator with XRE-family HTH domain [Saccharothrix tamanrassetensis]